MTQPIKLAELVAFLTDTLEKNGDCDVYINTDAYQPKTLELTKVFYHEVENAVYLEGTEK